MFTTHGSRTAWIAYLIPPVCNPNEQPPPKLNLFPVIFHHLSPPQRWSVFLHQIARLWEQKRAPSHPEHGGQRPPHTNCLLASSLILLNHDILWFLSAFRSYKPISCGSLCQTSQRRLRLLIGLFQFTTKQEARVHPCPFWARFSPKDLK